MGKLFKHWDVIGDVISIEFDRILVQEVGEKILLNIAEAVAEQPGTTRKSIPRSFRVRGGAAALQVFLTRITCFKLIEEVVFEDIEES